MKKVLFILIVFVFLLASTYCYLIRPFTEQIFDSVPPIMPVEYNIFRNIEGESAHRVPFLCGAIIAVILSLMLIFAGTYKFADKRTDNKALLVAGMAYMILTLVLVAIVYGLDLIL